MLYIYVLKLSCNKYYVGKTTNPEFRLDSHFDSDGSAWTLKYKPIGLVDLIPKIYGNVTDIETAYNEVKKFKSKYCNLTKWIWKHRCV